MTAAPPVVRLARGVFQYGFRQSMVEVDEQRAMDEERFPPPGLSVAGDFSTADRNIGGSLRRPGETEGVENRTDKVCTQSESGFQVEAGGGGCHERVVQHAGSLEHTASASGALQHFHSKARTRGFVHHMFGPFAGADDYGGRPTPPEPQHAPSRLPGRARQRVIQCKIPTHGRSRPAHDIQL